MGTPSADDKAEPLDDAQRLAGWLRAQELKDLVRFVTIGSVDDGKSTLIGRLLHDAQGLYQDQLDAVRRASVRGATRGEGSRAELDLALVTDGLLAEREQGITIDVAYRYFATERRKFIIADTPGHVQYTRNMATGASTAEVALILVDARAGVLAQTRRHTQIAALLGIPHVVACVNKMDLVDCGQARFDEIVAELAVLSKSVGLRELFAIPVSALAGDNVVTPSERMPWWKGGTLLSHLETVSVNDERRSAAFRLPVQIVLRPGLAYRGFGGQIASGTIRTGDEIVALPSGKRSRVVGVDVAGVEVGVAAAPMSVAVRLADEIDVSRGDMLTLPDALPRVGTEVEADLVWMSERHLDTDKTYLLKHTTRTVRAEIEVIHTTDPETLGPLPAETLALNDIGRVRVRCRAPLFFDAYRDNRTTGAFILIDSVTNDTVAAGMIAGAAAPLSSPDGPRVRTAVSSRERRERLGQAGAVVQLVGRTADEARELSFALERVLFDRGRIATVVESENAGECAEACARGGLVGIVPVCDATSAGLAAEVAGERLHGSEPDELVDRVASSLEAREGVAPSSRR